jgi:hypothetical protein
MVGIDLENAINLNGPMLVQEIGKITENRLNFETVAKVIKIWASSK